MKWPSKLNQAGDTIIEVMIVLAVLGLAFSISSATATKGLSQARAAEEHSQAMGTANAQMEMLRKAVANKAKLPPDPAAPSNPFCMKSSTPVVTTDSSCTTGFYKSSIKYTAGTLPNQYYYTLTVSWPGAGGLGPQREVFTYRAQDIPSGTATGTYTIALPPPPIIKVAVQKYQPAANNTSPNCANTAIVSRPGTSVTLTKVGTTSSQPGTSPATFVVGFGSSYNATVNVSGQPGGFKACGANPSTPAVVANDSGITITMTISPMCYTYQSSWNSYWVQDGRRSDLDGKWTDFGNDYWAWIYGQSSSVYYHFVRHGSWSGNGYKFYYVWNAHWQNDPVFSNACPQ